MRHGKVQNMKTEIVNQLKVWKDENFYTWQEIADILEVSQSTVISWITSERNPSARNIRKIKDLLKK